MSGDQPDLMIVEPGKGSKRPQPDADEEKSPSKVRGGEVAVTPSFLRDLLQQQTKELKEAQQLELNSAMGKMESAMQRMESNTAKQLDTVKAHLDQVNHAIKEHEDQLGAIKHGQTVIEKRLAALEAGGSCAASTVDSERIHRLTAVVGGWPSNTPKDELLREMDKLVDKLNLRGLLDDKFFTTGLRRGFAMVNFRVRDGEHSDLAMTRLMDVVQTIRMAGLELPVQGGAKLIWSALSRPKIERDRAGHVGKVRRIYHRHQPSGISHLECEYKTGTCFVTPQLLD